MSIHRDSIFQFIAKNQPVFRSEIIEEYNYLAKPTVYRHITRLIEEGLVFEDDTKYLRIRENDVTAFVFHPIISRRQNVTPISNAYYRDPEQLKAMVEIYLLEHGEAMGKLFIDLFYLFQAVANSSAETPEKTYEINIKELKESIEEIIKSVSILEK